MKREVRKRFDCSTRRFLRLLAIGAILTALYSTNAIAEDGAEKVTIGGPFTLTAADGSTVTEASFPGRWLLVFFGYTFCPDVCPTTLTLVADALDGLGEDAGRLQPLFISVDPDRDTPEILGAYAAAFDPRIVALTGAPDRIAAVADAYGVHYRIRRTGPDDEFYPVDHSIYLYLLDPDGVFVRAMDLGQSGDRIAETLRDIIRQR